MSDKTSIKDKLISTVGITPKDPIAWLYAARGYYKLRDYVSCIEAITPALRHEKTKRESQHLLAFSLMYTGQKEAAASAFFKSINYGNETDWQPLVELLLEESKIKLV